jgi:hypothetical protein
MIAGVLLGCGPVLVLTDEHNAHLEVELEVRLDEVAPSPGEVELDWSGLEVDLEGGPLDPSEIARVQLLYFPDLEPGQVAQGLVNEELEQTELALAVWGEPEGSSVRLAELGLLEGPVELDEWFVEDGASWLVVLEDSSGQARWLSFLRPSAESSVVRVELIAEAGLLEVGGHLGQAVPVGPETVLDWSEVRTSTLGQDLVHRQLDEGVLYGVEASPQDIEADGLGLDELATERLEVDVEGQTRLALESLDLSGAERWLLALSCSTCTAPSPRLVVLLEP